MFREVNSLKIIYVATISTTIVLLLGVFIVAPVFFREQNGQDNLRVMLSFDVHHNANNISLWCNELASVLKEENVKATVFFSGKIAEENPEILAYFGDGIDIGSQTYNYVNLTSISDFSVQLEEVQKGKQAVDDAGNLSSRVFSAPYGATDENIYYLLSQSDIIADFSYSQQYNLFQNGQFIKYDAIRYEGSLESVELISNDSNKSIPYIIAFDSSCSIQQILDVISGLKEAEVQFVNASDLAGLDLTRMGA